MGVALEELCLSSMPFRGMLKPCSVYYCMNTRFFRISENANQRTEYFRVSRGEFERFTSRG